MIDGAFSPEDLMNIGSRCVLSQIVELLLLKLGVMLLPSQLPWLTIVAILGYKFVSLCLNRVFFLLLGNLGYYPSIFYFAAAFGFFVLKAMSANCPLSPSGISVGSDGNTTNQGIQPSRASVLPPHLIFAAMAGIEFLAIFFLGMA